MKLKFSAMRVWIGTLLTFGLLVFVMGAWEAEAARTKILSANPTSLAFGNVVVNASSSTSTTITNKGTANVKITNATTTVAGMTITSAQVYPFTLARNGGTTTYTVRFAPTVAGAVSGNLAITSDATISPTNVALSGTGVAATPITIGKKGINGSTGGSQTAITATWTDGGSTAGSDAIIVVLYSDLNTYTTANIKDSAANTYTLNKMVAHPHSNGGYVYLFSALNAAAASSITVTPPAWDHFQFAMLEYAGLLTSGAFDIAGTVRNNGYQGAAGSAIPWMTNASGTLATQPELVLAINAEAYGTVTAFSGTGYTQQVFRRGDRALGVLDAVVTSTSSITPSGTYAASGSSYVGSFVVTYKGNGVVVPRKTLSANPTSLAFGNVVVNGNHSLLTTITNTGTVSVTISAASATGTGMGITSQPTLPLTLAPNATTTYTVRFMPTVEGAVTGNLAITSDATTSPNNISLSGTGVVTTKILSANPTRLAFGNVLINASSSMSTTITNTGNTSVTLSEASAPTVAGMTITSAHVYPFTLAPNASTTYTVKFAPTGAEAVTGNLVITSDATTSLNNTALSGTGVTTPPPTTGTPVILFTDVAYGPKTGGPNNLGVPISIFGRGFGATRGTSTVTIGGVEVGSYMVWGERNAHNTTLDMIVVQPGANVLNGPIQVSVTGTNSNTDFQFTTNTGKINYISTTGSDSAVCAETAPCATISHTVANVMKPGDTVLVRGGTYQEGEIFLRSTMGGTISAPKTIKRYPGEEAALANGARPFIIDTDYVTVSGFNFQNGKSTGAAGWANRHQSGVKIIDSTFVGIIAYDAISSHGDNHVFAGNVCRVQGSTTGTQGHCYYISDGSNIKLLYNVGSGAPGYAIHIYDQRRSTNDFQRIIKNVLIEGNLLFGSPERSGMLISMDDEAGLGNYISDITIRNNIFTGNNFVGVTLQNRVSNVKVYNNTFYENGTQSLYVGGGAGVEAKGINVYNNLFYQTNPPMPNNGVCKSNCAWYTPAHIAISAFSTGITVNGNYFGPGAPVAVNTQSAGSPIPNPDLTPVSGTVIFANPGLYDFRIQSSPTTPFDIGAYPVQ